MSEPLPPHAVVCPECGATVTRPAEEGVTRCWLCGHNVARQLTNLLGQLHPSSASRL